MLNCFSQGPCSFEPGLCGWKDTSLGAYKWDRNKGNTIVAGTGPSVDHTCGNASCKQPNDYFFLDMKFIGKTHRWSVQSTESMLHSVHCTPFVKFFVKFLSRILCFTVRSRLIVSLNGSTAFFIWFSINYANADVQKVPNIVVFRFCQLLLDRQSTRTISTIAFLFCTGSNFIVLCSNGRLLCLCPLWRWFIFWGCNFTKS